MKKEKDRTRHKTRVRFIHSESFREAIASIHIPMATHSSQDSLQEQLHARQVQIISKLLLHAAGGCLWLQRNTREEGFS